MTDFREAFLRTMQHEGNYSKDPKDPGGETYKGISRRHWPQWDGWELIDSLGPNVYNAELQRRVERFYLRNFWEPLRCDSFPQAIANELFDTAVNIGVKNAAFFFQRAINLFNQGGTLYPNVTTDGAIGNETLKAFDKIPSKYLGHLLTAMNVYQGAYYIDRMETDERNERWVGWFNRVSL